MKLPSLFIGHGSPMNAIENNNYSRFLGELSSLFPRPNTILAISAHWSTHGTKVLRVENPKTIHDFGGFPDELYKIQYPAKGDLALADRIVDIGKDFKLQADNEWGLDHGTWAVLRHLYPLADIPVVQLSLDVNKSFDEHVELARCLRKLRDEGTLILASGNITHNLGRVVWDKNARPLDWALKFDGLVKEALIKHDEQFLLRKDPAHAELWSLAHPTLEHYIPLLYTYGASFESETPQFIYEGMELGSLSMRSFFYK